MNKVKQVYRDALHVYKAVEHLLAPLSILVVSIYAGYSAYQDTTMDSVWRKVVMVAALITLYLATKELYKHFKSVQLEK